MLESVDDKAAKKSGDNDCARRRRQMLMVRMRDRQLLCSGWTLFQHHQRSITAQYTGQLCLGLDAIQQRWLNVEHMEEWLTLPQQEHLQTNPRLSQHVPGTPPDCVKVLCKRGNIPRAIVRLEEGTFALHLSTLVLEAIIMAGSAIEMLPPRTSALSLLRIEISSSAAARLRYYCVSSTSAFDLVILFLMRIDSGLSVFEPSAEWLI